MYHSGANNNEVSYIVLGMFLGVWLCVTVQTFIKNTVREMYKHFLTKEKKYREHYEEESSDEGDTTEEESGPKNEENTNPSDKNDFGTKSFKFLPHAGGTDREDKCTKGEPTNLQKTGLLGKPDKLDRSDKPGKINRLDPFEKYLHLSTSSPSNDSYCPSASRILTESEGRKSVVEDTNFFTQSSGKYATMTELEDNLKRRIDLSKGTQ